MPHLTHRGNGGVCAGFTAGARWAATRRRRRRVPRSVGASDENAHPHMDAENKVAVVHNGII
ncbi:hypothetical protein ACWECC_39180, partial [Streptomyces microflavus]